MLRQNAMNATIMIFGILDGSTYMQASGRRGRYSYDAKSGVLTLDPGGRPARYQRISPTSFRVIDPATGQLGGFVCPLNRAKNPGARPGENLLGNRSARA
jgi:hypothetical protein